MKIAAWPGTNLTYAAFAMASRRSAGAPEIFKIRIGLFGLVVVAILAMGYKLRMGQINAVEEPL